MRMLGSVALALGICAGVAAVWLACLSPVLVYEKYFPEIHGRLYSRGPSPLPHQISSLILVTLSIWMVSRLIFRGRMLGRNVLCALMVLLGTALCEAAIVLGVYEVTDFLSDAVRNGYSFPFWLSLVVVGVGYLIPHFVAIGGDLLRGSRSRLTSPVILSCFWSVPACILGGFYLAANTSYSVLGIPISDMQIVVAGFAAVLCIAAIELLSWLAVRISFLPEP
jgi:hypothetical protein